MKVRWTPEAEQDRLYIWRYIAEDNPAAATKIDRLFATATASLSRFPKIGPEGRIPGTRELLPHKSYRLVYEITDNTVWVLTLVHTAQQWPPAH